MPEHFGLVSMVTEIIVFADRFIDMGLSLATVQSQKITHAQVSNLFWINVALGFFTTALVAMLSTVVAWFYGDERLTNITLALSTIFCFGGFSIQHQALLRRQMKFGLLSLNRILSTLLSVALGIAMALYGFEYWALVGKEVSRVALVAVGALVMCRWRPGLPVRRSGVGSMIRFGKYVTGNDLINFLSRSLDQILIGRFYGADALGYYRQAYQLIIQPTKMLQFPIQYVAEPTLSVVQDDGKRYRDYYNMILSGLSFIAMPLFLYLGLFSENVVRVVLGEKWMQAVPLFRLLAFAALVQILTGTCGFVMVTCGMTRRFFWWGVMNAASLIAAFSIGIFWGPLGVATAYLVASYAMLPVSLWYSFRHTPVSVNEFIRAISLPLQATAVMGLLLLLTLDAVASFSPISQLSITLFLASACYLFAWMFLPGGRQQLNTFISLPLSLLRVNASGTKT
jgi:O-antigen/teichoic acid export membrane protein